MQSLSTVCRVGAGGLRLLELRAVANSKVAEQEYSRSQQACRGPPQPGSLLPPLSLQLPELHQATSSSGNPILPGSPQWITLDTCLNHISPDSQREDASSTHRHRQTTSGIPVLSYSYSDRDVMLSLNTD
ncbi:unnamed protein product [Pleuronectes platessa]|uniref:Uncharacterized protein n=1 Tax=Pleuronectes platessa TaxID=8262 RepID=A0A9N7ZDS1_PLEPL|nr:unnamed protein product [Pleuronectes platessa]